MKKKVRDPSWKLRHALGHRVDPDLKKYTRKIKHKKKVDKAKARKACMSLYKDNKEMPDGLEIKRVKRVRMS